LKYAGGITTRFVCSRGPKDLLHRYNLFEPPLDTQSRSKLRPGRRLEHLGLRLVNLDELAHGKVKEDVLGPSGDAGAHDLAVEH